MFSNVDRPVAWSMAMVSPSITVSVRSAVMPDVEPAKNYMLYAQLAEGADPLPRLGQGGPVSSPRPLTAPRFRPMDKPPPL
jgi:hypothetical protein